MAIQYRRVALDKLSSPDELDHLPCLITPRLFFFLFYIFVLVTAVLVWGVIGSIPQAVKAQGVIQLHGDMVIESSNAGEVQGVFVTEGEMIEPGQLVAIIRQESEQNKLLESQEQLRSKMDELRRKEDHEQARLDATGRKISINRAFYETQYADKINEIKWLSEKRDNQQALWQKGLDTKSNYIAAENNYKAALNDLKDIKVKLQQLDVDEITTRNDSKETLKSLDRSIEEQVLKVRGQQRELVRELNVMSRYRGRVLEVNTQIGRQVSVGQTLIRLATADDMDKGLNVRLYIPPNDGAKVKPGMRVIVSPYSVDFGVYGDLVGFVTSVSSSTVSSDHMKTVLQNDLLVQNLTVNGAPYEVTAFFLPDPNSLNGLKWTTRKGAAVSIESGTLCSAKVIIEHKRPIDYIMPFLRERVMGQKEQKWLSTDDDND